MNTATEDKTVVALQELALDLSRTQAVRRVGAALYAAQQQATGQTAAQRYTAFKQRPCDGQRVDGSGKPS